MREILFRGKRDNGGGWLVGGYNFFYLSNGELVVYLSDWGNENEKVIPETVGQYTGLTDKNGTKIFEGDIIQTKRKLLDGEKILRFVVKYGPYIPKEYCKEIYGKFETIGFYAFDGKKDFQLSNRPQFLEVIGNIHDNPELLKSEVSK